MTTSRYNKKRHVRYVRKKGFKVPTKVQTTDYETMKENKKIVHVYLKLNSNTNPRLFSPKIPKYYQFSILYIWRSSFFIFKWIMSYFLEFTDSVARIAHRKLGIQRR